MSHTKCLKNVSFNKMSHSKCFTLNVSKMSHSKYLQKCHIKNVSFKMSKKCLIHQNVLLKMSHAFSGISKTLFAPLTSVSTPIPFASDMNWEMVLVKTTIMDLYVTMIMGTVVYQAESQRKFANVAIRLVCVNLPKDHHRRFLDPGMRFCWLIGTKIFGIGCYHQFQVV